MRNLNELNEYRAVEVEKELTNGRTGDHENGCFIIPCPLTGKKLKVIASIGMGWEHVSVSLNVRIPKWNEMEYIKRKFFKENETVMQLHVPSSDHINIHPNCLHLWKPIGVEIPRPPGLMV